MNQPPNEPLEFSEKEANRVVDEFLKLRTTTFKQSASLRSELKNLTDMNRFWLGEESYSEVQNYIDSTLDYLYAIEGKPANEEKVRRLAAKREKSRVSIRQIRDKLLEE